MFNHRRYAMIGLAAIAAAFVITFAVGRSSPPAAPIKNFDETFKDTNTTIISKTVDPVRVIRTETIKFEDRVLTPPPEPIEPPPPPPKKEKVKVATEHNICTRHNMHKVWVDKYRWRCRKT